MPHVVPTAATADGQAPSRHSQSLNISPADGQKWFGVPETESTRLDDE